MEKGKTRDPHPLIPWGTDIAAFFLAATVALTLCRQISSCAASMALYQNLFFMAALLGTGLGCAGKDEGLSHLLSLPGRLLALLFALALLNVATLASPIVASEKFAGNGTMSALFLLALLFSAVVWVTLPLGQGMARAIQGISPSRVLTSALAGTAGGLLLFALSRHLQFPPATLLGAAFLAHAACAAREGLPRRGMTATAALWVLCLGAACYPGMASVWSPYCKVSIEQAPAWLSGIEQGPCKSTLAPFQVLADNEAIDFAVNLDPAALDTACGKNHPLRNRLLELAVLMDSPFRLAGPGRIAIIGPGLGDPAAAALRSGARDVEMVDPDPVITRIGCQRHPELPYRDPRARLSIGSPRIMLERDNSPHALILYYFHAPRALLSPVTMISPQSFDITIQAMETAARDLASDGVIAAMIEGARTDNLPRVTFAMLDSIYPDETRAWLTRGGLADKPIVVIAGGPGVRFLPSRPVLPFEDVTKEFMKSAQARVPTDDRPMFRHSYHNMSLNYFMNLFWLIPVCMIFTYRSLARPLPLRAGLILLGAGSYLILARCVTGAALAAGAVWQVESATVTAFAFAFLLSARYLSKAPETALYALLGGSMAFSLALPPAKPLAAVGAASALATAILAGAVFGHAFKRSGQAAPAVCSAAMGAAAGGMIEYMSVMTGFRALYTAALILFLAAFLVRKR